ncbi:acyltransferase family protein [Lysobacter sp. F6437]|uniref:acyltransferase family protein n=1 Tax=Lysobacter sp. F6437 TaxID=3459296 RepID=UPI00403E2A7F
MAKKLQWLEAMRAVAACWVLVHHANQSVSAFVGPLGAGSVVIANGYLGVDFFFVLSGFIIALSSNRLLETGRGFGDYARARLIRIYVPYLPIGISMLLLYLLFPNLSAADRTPGVLTSLTLLPSVSPPALSVAWTLIHELLFYALFSLIFVSRKALWWLLVVWAALIVGQAWVGPPLSLGWKYLLSPLNLCFLLGVAVYYLTRNGVRAWAPVVGGIIGAVVLALEVGQPNPNRWLLALAFAGFIVCALSTWAQRWSPGGVGTLHRRSVVLDLSGSQPAAIDCRPHPEAFHPGCGPTAGVLADHHSGVGRRAGLLLFLRKAWAGTGAKNVRIANRLSNRYARLRGCGGRQSMISSMLFHAT